jgi:two-component system OmpR family sensor kinase
VARQFLGLYLLVVVTLVAASWGQDELLQRYGGQTAADDKPLSVALSVLSERLAGLPEDQWPRYVAGVAGASQSDMELIATRDVVGRDTLEKLARGEIAHMRGSGEESWTLKQLNPDYVLALKSLDPDSRRGALEWTLTLGFYAAIAFVLMIWIWPLTRDLKRLEKAVARFGDRNWTFDANLTPRSQIHPLAETFRRMAARIDGLIASHKDMTNAVSHEIRTPLARMQFEIEMASRAGGLEEVRRSLDNIKSDICEISDLVTATLDYAILERADMALNLGTHDFSALLPAIAEAVRRDAGSALRVTATVRGNAGQVVCDLHLMESVLRNLLYNAMRYARREIQVTFDAGVEHNSLTVDDDGPGIAAADRERVFQSFVRLEGGGRKTGFGLGLAIVKRAVEWHRGRVAVEDSPLGGARLVVTWPSSGP